MAKSGRQQRIEGEIQRVIAELTSRGVKDPRVGHVTITAVQVAPDLSTARVFFLPFGKKHSIDEVAAGFASAAGYLRGEVGRRLGLRHAPRLEFAPDRHLEQASHLSSLIDRAVNADRSRTDAVPGDGSDAARGDGAAPRGED